eukprot:3635404-Rhodomonas_salina.2
MKCSTSVAHGMYLFRSGCRTSTDTRFDAERSHLNVDPVFKPDCLGNWERGPDAASVQRRRGDVGVWRMMMGGASREGKTDRKKKTPEKRKRKEKEGGGAENGGRRSEADRHFGSRGRSASRPEAGCPVSVLDLASRMNSPSMLQGRSLGSELWVQCLRFRVEGLEC